MMLSTINIIKALDIVFSQIIAKLHFNQFNSL